MKDSANIVVSNSFGSLEDITESPETQEAVMVTDENKENKDMSNQRRKGLSGGQGNIPMRRNEIGKEGIKDSRLGNIKGQGNFGPRPKQSKGVKPTSGLIFGPVKGDLEMSATGKRFRVERGNVGRSGGSFANNSGGVVEEIREIHNAGAPVGDVHERFEEAAGVNEIKHQQDMPDGGTAMVVRVEGKQ